MTRISEEALIAAIHKVGIMNLDEKELLADEIFLHQPAMLGFLLVLERFGVSARKMEFLTYILFLCYQAMKETKVAWPMITEDELEWHMSNLVMNVKLTEYPGKTRVTKSMADYIKSHQEKNLLAYVTDRVNNWQKEIEPEESDKYVMILAVSYVNCIASVALP